MHNLLPSICPIFRKAIPSAPATSSTAHHVRLESACDTLEKQSGQHLPFMENSPPDLQTIAKLLSQSHGYKDLFRNLGKAMKTTGFEKVEKSSSNIFHYADYKVLATLSAHSAIEAKKLSVVKPLKLSCAPELIAHFPVGPDESVLITKGNGNLLPYDEVKEKLPVERKQQFLKDIEALLANDLHHPYANRGTREWYVDKNTQNIVLDEWSNLSQMTEPAAKKEVLETTKKLLEV